MKLDIEGKSCSTENATKYEENEELMLSGANET